ncbi:MAG: OmpA family protein [Gammaproteobacteria bacterium]|nr:OmpA family protein [Gammaproteobacteria bacterium]
MLRQLFTAAAAFLVSLPVVAAPPGAIISNQATLYYEPSPGLTAAVASNIVEITAAVVRSPASIEFTRVVAAGSGDYQESVGPTACSQGGTFVTLADPVLVGGVTIDPAQTQDVAVTGAYNLGEAAFIRLSDSDQNLDFQIAEFVQVTVSSPASGDSETLQLTETGPDTGVFAGYIPTSASVAVVGDCVLQGTTGAVLVVNYSDPADSADSASATAQLDPVQRVFESRTGSVVNGVAVELVDAVSGLPAVVYGNDGVSQFPSLIVSGTTVTDSSGTAYVFGPGEYRFPVVPDGDYRLVVTPPPEYAAPSSVAIGDLQNLPGAPYALEPGSFGNPFSKSGDLSFAIDIPVDPQSSALFLQKRTTTTIAAPGDFVRYELVLENPSAVGDANNVRITDQLPPGVRLVAGSVRMNGIEIPDPPLNSDMRTLEFPVGSLAAGQRATIFYVVEIINGERNQELVNVATAFANAGLISNEATATIRLTEDLFRSTGTIIGRVLEADCGQDSFSEEQGVANIRVYLEDGRYAVSDESGRFHFEGLPPGTHVAQLDTFTVPDWFDVTGCRDTPGFAGRADSQFVKLTAGSLLRADFFLKRKPAPEGRIDLELRNVGAESAEQVAYELKLHGIGNVSIENIDLMILLPDGVHYAPGSMRVDGRDLGDPRVAEQALSMAIDDQFGNWTSEIRFVANIDAHADGELVTRALGKFDSPIEAKQQTPVAETRMIREPAVMKNEGYVLDLRFGVLSDQLSFEDRAKLDALIREWDGVSNVQISATGHSDSQPIAVRNRHLFADNYVLSRARALSAARYLADALAVPVENIQVEGRGPDYPVDSNATAAGRQKNRRVEMVISGVRPSKPSFLEVTQESSGTKVTPTLGAIPGTEKQRSPLDDIDPDAGMPASQIEPDIDSLKPGVALLLPKRTFAPAIPTTKISVQHGPRQSVKVYLNDRPVNSLSFDAMAMNSSRTVAVSRWKGVDLQDGDNEIRVVVSNADGSRAKSVKRNIYYSGPAIRGEFVEELSTLVADGKTRPIIAVRLFDRAGRRSRAGIVGGFRIEAPYRAWWDVENARKNELVAIGPREPTYRVGNDGIAYLELEPTTQAGEVSVSLRFEHQRQQELRAWLKPAARDWILVGFAEGTAGYNTLSDNIDAAIAAGQEEGYVDEGRIAFFAKGSIKGEYLLTLAYDSARDRDDNRDRFATVIDPNAHYPLFADTSEQRFEAPSQRKLYVKLERQQFSALFGDFNTGLSITDLSRYERRFNGLKSEYRGDNLGYTAFAAATNQSFHRDEIRGDGTSGLYRLSSAPIIGNSDSVRIEVRDRMDTGQVLNSTNLTRFLDYNLDTQRGTLFFKQPIPNRDLNFNPVFIVVEYESESNADEDIVAGGRGSIRLADNQLEIGVTHVRDETTGAEADLTGVDMRWQMNAQTLLKAEYAETNSTVASVENSGTAQSISLEHNGERVDVRAYIREVEDDFGMGYQSAADKGFRRLGVDVRSEISERLSLDGEAGWQQNLETQDIRNLARAQLRYERESFAATLGVTHAEDKFDDGEKRTSDLADIGVSQKLFGGKLTLRAGTSTAIADDADNTDFTDRFVLGADYSVSKNVDLIAEYEEADGAGIDATMTRLGIRATPWSRAQMNTYVSEEVTEFGPRLFANVGLVQGFQLNDRWTFDIGVDQSNTLVGPDARPFDGDRELVSGSLNEDFLAAFVGAMYSAEAWSANSRIEHRNSDSEERTSLLMGWYRQPSAGHGLSAGLKILESANISGNELTTADLKVGWAYRMANSEWSFLDRVDLIYEDANTSGEALNTWRLINNFNANRRFSAATQMSLQYAFKYVRSEFGGDGYTGYTDLLGFDLRRGIRGNWDIGANASLYHSYESEIIDYGFGVDVGYKLRDNMWLTLGYNLTGFHDSDFSQARYTAQGPYLRISIKADQQTLMRIAGR